jgi:hypothetical protein
VTKHHPVRLGMAAPTGGPAVLDGEPADGPNAT